LSLEYPLFERLDALRNTLTGDAAKAMDKLLSLLEPQPKKRGKTSNSRVEYKPIDLGTDRVRIDVEKADTPWGQNIHQGVNSHGAWKLSHNNFLALLSTNGICSRLSLSQAFEAAYARRSPYTRCCDSTEEVFLCHASSIL
jgi:hypothetical protein